MICYKTNEVLNYFKITKKTLYKLIEDGKIESFTISNQYRFTEEAIQNYIRNNNKATRERDND